MINFIYGIIIFILTGILIVGVLILLKLFTYLGNKEIIKNKEIDLKKMQLYSSLDPKLLNNELDEWIKKYINKYIIKNFLVHDIQFIKKDEIDEMIKNITKIAMLDMSDMYLFYVKLLINIEDENNVLSFIYDKVSDLVLDVVTEFNKAN